MLLDGPWRAAVAARPGGHSGLTEPEADESGWEAVEVPGHWRSTPAFAACDGPLVYRTRFEANPPAAGRRSWLTFEGIFYRARVWLDGDLLGDTEGYFFPHTFEVTSHLRTRTTDHVLAVQVACETERDLRRKKNLTGIFQHWDCLDPDWNPGGIWRPVRLAETGPVALRTLRVLCPEASNARAVVHLRAVVDVAQPTDVRVRMALGDETQRVDRRRLPAGQHRLAWPLTVERPALWWPHALGDQPLHDVTVAVEAEGEGEGEGEGAVSDRRCVTTGLRQVRMDDWVLSVNGERLFLKGSNLGPAQMALGEARPEELESDVATAKGAGLDLLRIHGHVTRPEVYDAADRHGMLLWQDLPLQWGYSRRVRAQALRQASEAVDLLAHHPSLAVWCGHNEPLAVAVDPGRVDIAALARRSVALQLLPTWNKNVLDPAIARGLDRSDGTRPVVAHSGVLPHPGSDGTDSHLFFGWYWGRDEGVARLCARWPRLARFVSEFGAQAVPATAEFMAPERWPDLDWALLARRHALQRDVFERLDLGPGRFATFEDWRDATQHHQAELVRFHVETLRRLKYHPTGGFAQFLLADAQPAITWSLLDHARVPKPAWHALVAACAPVIVVADRPHPTYRPGDPVVLDVHVVSDLRQPLPAARVSARLTWAGGHHTWAWEGDIPADDCVRVGTIQAVTAPSPGSLVLDLELVAGGRTVTNRYASTVAG